MLYLTYEVVTKRKGSQPIAKYCQTKTRKMSSEILPKLLRDFFKAHPDQSLVYAKLYEFVKE